MPLISDPICQAGAKQGGEVGGGGEIAAQGVGWLGKIDAVGVVSVLVVVEAVVHERFHRHGPLGEEAVKVGGEGIHGLHFT